MRSYIDIMNSEKNKSFAQDLYDIQMEQTTSLLRALEEDRQQRLLNRASNDPQLVKIKKENELKGIEKYLNWGKVKTFGDLKLLTKASYLILLFVPLLAGFWPILQNITPLISDLPSVWSWIFFAALAVILGHLIYEAFTPENIKNLSRDEFATNQLVLSGIISDNGAQKDSSITNENLKQFTADLKSYNEQSVSGRYKIIISILLYTISFLIIITVVLRQTVNVWNAGGGFSEIFSWLTPVFN